MGLVRGDMSWASFLLVWMAKVLILRLGRVNFSGEAFRKFVGLVLIPRP